MKEIPSIGHRLWECVKDVIPNAKKTAIWIVEITAIVSAVIFILRAVNVIPFISNAVSPVMKFVGLPGEASLAYVSGYFVNVYSAIAAAVTLGLTRRSMTILAVMAMCSHSMIVETAVQKKTGSSAIRIVIIRTLSGIVLASLLNLILPEEAAAATSSAAVANPPFWIMFKEWIISLVKLCIKIIILIFLLSVLQKILKEFGIINVISKFLNWPLKFFGLSPNTSFLWIVANTLGLAYGAAVMFQEKESGHVSQREIQLLNSHIAISHSNLEDLILFTSVGGIWWIILLTRWAGSFVLVWEERLEFYLKDRRRAAA
ncbi:MAG TPA: hypothetical protein PK500_07400 [Candidatus Egerieousia sp.]|nr:hypothetical protein [Candidatus Egerieousia sp.]HPT06458.1 hypothetical protein [Candidatus Egerieousia sp.]